MASGDVVYEEDNVQVMDVYTATTGAGTVPDPIGEWKINFRSHGSTRTLITSFDVTQGSSALGANPFDPSKSYDIIVKEH